MLSKFITVSETHFQNTEIALKNQKTSIQGLKTQIGQLSKLISERPQGSLLSNTEPNLREQLNAINVQDEEGFVEPEQVPRQETVVSKGQGEMSNAMKFLNELLANKRKLDKASHMELNTVCSAILLKIEELDEWRTYKLRTCDKPKLRQDELNTFPNQLKVRDKVLSDVVDLHIVTTKQNEEIPLTCLTPNLLTELLNTGFPHRHDLAHGRALGRVETG
ncbi:hypothetical protein GOBAR_AA39120 [Gossypium barbadense]|uniref:Uncharacterized protein n=1 Tax=Gossypium barbadense TaxID=3634 RepID=A0A2P5VRY4_GOSBA|nr:hypothetical protein GOBAR_AA39120 [Gossypium barbadense]